ncbi:MAG TPA: organomercurial lyase [Candidatus Polarisedimenticolaceae bacterium]|nr:organomercurial lyase [Candidatus Polarisedimenticolaceae bacterium]
MDAPGSDFDVEVKLAIYRRLAETRVAPTSTDLARELRVAAPEVEAAFRRLHAKRLLVPEPGDPSRIRMAPPFSGVPTPFPVEARGRRYYANCVWDALGIPAALHADAVIPASDGFDGEQIVLEVRGERPLPRDCVIHFAVPAARWWDDIIDT